VVAVDRLAAASIFVAFKANSVVFSTELAPLLRLLDVQPAPDRAALARWLSTGMTPYGRTLYDGVRRLTDGQSISFENGRIYSHRYWAPHWVEPFAEDEDELAQRVRGAVSHAVAGRMPPPGQAAAILVSGGLDSGTIAALAAREREADGVSLRGYSATFPDHPAVDESGLVLELSERLGLGVELVTVRTTSMLTAALRYLDNWRVPCPSPNLHFMSRLASSAREEGAAVIFDGEGGDELFAFSPFYLADLLRRGRAIRATGLAHRFPGLGASSSGRQIRRLLWSYGVKGAVPLGMHRRVRRRRPPELRAPVWLNEGSARVLADGDEEWDWKAISDGPLWWRARVDDLVLRRQRIAATDYLRRITGPGTLDAHPLLDDLDLVELALRLPPPASFDPDYDRPLLRRAVDGLLPDSIRLRRDKSFFDQLFRDCLEGPDRRAVEKLLGVPGARVNAYVRPDVVRSSLIDAPPNRRNGRWAWTTWRLLVLETWLRSLEDSRFPAQALEELVAP
jgi:asparagine synthase (glutamine-hydrolysing)